MKEETIEWLNHIRNIECERVLAIGEVVSDYFGEDLVDVQLDDIEIIVERAFPHVPLSSLLAPINQNEDTVTLAYPGRNLTLTVPKKEFEEDCKGLWQENLRETYHEILTPWAQRIIHQYYVDRTTSILIRFPEVKVQNENDASVMIKELYAKFNIRTNGTLRNYFQLNRAHYPATHYLSGYSHSHLPGIHFEFVEPCLGSGPIIATQSSLHDHYDLDRYGLFCYELSKYVTVESLAGVPYRRLENIGQTPRRTANMTSVRYRSITENGVVKNFVRYYIRTQSFPLAFSDGAYKLGVPLLDFIISISKCFIQWYNECKKAGFYTDGLREFVEWQVLERYVIENKKLYVCSSGRSDVPSDIESARGRILFEFKGAPVHLEITEDTEEDETNNEVILLRPDVVNAIINRCLRVINYNYGQSKNIQAPTREKKLYL